MVDCGWKSTALIGYPKHLTDYTITNYKIILLRKNRRKLQNTIILTTICFKLFQSCSYTDIFFPVIQLAILITFGLEWIHWLLICAWQRKKLQLRVCKNCVESAVLFCRWACTCSWFVCPHPFLTAKSSNAARLPRTAFTWTWQLTYTITLIILISSVVCS